MISEGYRFPSQGLELTGLMVAPDSGLAKGGVVCVTGGSPEGCDVGYGEWQAYMAEEAGLASLSFNARGVEGSEGSFRIDDHDFSAQISPANSQASRTRDTVNAYRTLRREFEITGDASIGLIGASMGGDVAIHALEVIGAVPIVLKAPAAYHRYAHMLSFGAPMTQVLRNPDLSPLESANFQTLETLAPPTLLIFSRGEAVIPDDVQAAYKRTVTKIGGKIVEVGTKSTEHRYFTDDSPNSLAAKRQTIRCATEFLMRRLQILS